MHNAGCGLADAMIDYWKRIRAKTCIKIGLSIMIMIIQMIIIVMIIIKMKQPHQ